MSFKNASSDLINSAEESTKIADYGHHGLYVIKLPSRLWVYAGSIPDKLLIKKSGPYGEYLEPPIFSTKQQAIDYYNKKK